VLPPATAGPRKTHFQVANTSGDSRIARPRCGIPGLPIRYTASGRLFVCAATCHCMVVRGAARQRQRETSDDGGFMCMRKVGRAWVHREVPFYPQ
jgi:hypothetical protein